MHVNKLCVSMWAQFVVHVYLYKTLLIRIEPPDPIRMHEISELTRCNIINEDTCVHVLFYL